ncbi:hypothetical protein [Caballeronia zhejiangensis]|uniref:hypothetical protein n=1 Tax=Caballeronia zhejiangensis TaxID=871203 RepID=UPI00052EEDE3|nr:hypothetical protein [Caballeronia zhejiangensis]
MSKKKSKSNLPKASLKDLYSANDHQLQIYFERYDRFWRLNKLVLLRHLLGEREQLRHVYKDFYHWDSIEDEQVVYGNITNGILADAVSELVMLCEDYFSILRFIREPLFFVKKALSYSAGAVTNLPLWLSTPNDSTLRRMFFVPSEEITTAHYAYKDVSTAHAATIELEEHLECLKGLHKESVDFFKKHSDFHIQYKHGLKLALSGLHGSIPDDEVARRKLSYSAPLFAFENKPVGQLGYGAAMMILGIQFDPLRSNLSTLIKDLNLLHIQFLDAVDIDNCINLAKKLVQLIHALIANRIELIRHAGTDRIEFLIPTEKSNNLSLGKFSVNVPLGYSSPLVTDYQFD